MVQYGRVPVVYLLGGRITRTCMHAMKVAGKTGGGASVPSQNDLYRILVGPRQSYDLDFPDRRQ